MQAEKSGDWHGRCLCGAVTFAVTPPSLFVMHCHCNYCRIHHGAPFVTWLGVPKTQFRMVSGEDCVQRFKSSEQSTRSFCSACGTSLFFHSDLCDDEIHIARALISGDVDRLPMAHLFIEHKADWVDLHPDLPTLSGEEGPLAKYNAVKPLER